MYYHIRYIDFLSEAIHNQFLRHSELYTMEYAQTEINIELSKFGQEKLISRSQAKNITLGLDKFSYVTLDLSGVRLVGQGFVDEIFRVYKNSHSGGQLFYINANDDVKFMIERGLAIAKKN